MKLIVNVMFFIIIICSIVFADNIFEIEDSTVDKTFLERELLLPKINVTIKENNLIEKVELIKNMIISKPIDKYTTYLGNNTYNYVSKQINILNDVNEYESCNSALSFKITNDTIFFKLGKYNTTIKYIYDTLDVKRVDENIMFDIKKNDCSFYYNQSLLDDTIKVDSISYTFSKDSIINVDKVIDNNIIIDFTDAIEKQNIDIVKEGNKLIFTGENISKLDPTVLLNYTSDLYADTYIHSLNPTKNYGADSVIDTYSYSTFNMYAFLKFNNSLPSNVEIDSAVLTLNGGYSGNKINVSVFHVYAFPYYNISDIEWLEGNGGSSGDVASTGEMSWNNRPSSDMQMNLTYYNFTSIYTTTGYHFFDIKELLKNSISRKEQNISMLLNNTIYLSSRGTGFNSKEASTVSVRPYLNITYTILPSLPIVNFNYSTLPNGSEIINNSIIINTTISEINLSNIIYEWNNINYTFYDDSLVLLMNFDNMSVLDEDSTHISDFSKYQHANGTANGTITYIDSIYGGAYKINSVNNSYLEIPNIQSIQFINPANFTVAFWLNENQIWNTGTILEKWSGSGGYPFTFRQGVDKSIIFSRYNVTLNPTMSSQAIGMYNSWHFITGTVNITGSDNYMRLYIDGILRNTTVDTTKGFLPSSTSPLFIGKRGGATPFYMNGTLDELMIWNRTLNDSEIKQLYMSNIKKYDVENWAVIINQSIDNKINTFNKTYYYQVFVSDNNNNIGNTDRRSIIVNHTIIQMNNFDLINVSSFTNYTVLSINNSNIPYDNLVYYYSMDYNQSSDIINDYNNLYDGLAVRPQYIDDCKYGGCYNFTHGQWIRTIPSINTSQIHSISMWINMNDSVWMQGIVGSTSSRNIILFENTTKNFRIEKTNLENTATRRIYYTVTELQSGWNHLVVNFFNESIYLNNAEVSISSSSSIGLARHDYTAYYLGRSSASLFYRGAMDEVMIFNTTLSVNQINDIYNNQTLRFNQTGYKLSENITVFNINEVNVSIDKVQQYYGSSINARIGYKSNDTDVFSYSDYQLLSSNSPNARFIIPLNSTDMKIDFKLDSSLYNFYTPLLDNYITLSFTNINISDIDSCSCPVSNWLINNNCTFNNFNCNIDSYNISITQGTQINLINSNISANRIFCYIGDKCIIADMSSKVRVKI